MKSIPFFNRQTLMRCLPWLLLPLPSATAALVGNWEFNDNTDLTKASLGSALTFTGTVTSTTGPAGDTGAADFSKGAWASIVNPVPANGTLATPTRSNRYTLVLDFMVPDFTDGGTDTGAFTGIFDFNNGVDDADFFIRKQASAAELGVATQWPYVGAGPTAVGSGTSGTVRTNTWYRMVIVGDVGTARSVYLNGTLIGTYAAGTFDSARQSLPKTYPIRLLWDNTPTGTGAEISRVIVSNLAIFDTPLTSQQITQLGSAGASVILPRYAPITWTGASSQEWSTAIGTAPKNWKLDSDGVTTTDFETFDSVTFNDSVSNGSVVLSNGNVQATSVTFNHETLHYTLSGAGSITGTGTLSKNGAGTLTLQNANTYSGDTTALGGTIQIAHSQALQNTVVTTYFGSSQLTFDQVTTASIGGLAGSADLLLENSSSQPVALTLGKTGATASYSGQISGNGSLLKATTGTQELNYQNTFTGGTQLNAGTLRIGHVEALGTGPATHNGGSLMFSFGSGTVSNPMTLPSTGYQTWIVRGPSNTAPAAGAEVTLTGKISGGNPTQKYRLVDSNTAQNHNNVLILANPTNDFTGTIELWRGYLAFTSDAALGNADNDLYIECNGGNGGLRFDADGITLNANRTLTLPTANNQEAITVPSGTGTVAGQIIGTGALIKRGTGELVLSAASHTFTGGLTVDNGKLTLNGALATSANAVNVTTNGVLSGTGTLNRSLTAAGTIQPGASIGTLTTGSTVLTGTLAVEINGTAADQLIVTGDLNLTGSSLTVSLQGAGFTQTSYVIATYSGNLTGTIANVPSGYVVTYGSGQVVLTQQTLTGFETWASTKGVTGFNTDSDGDGIANGIEFVIGGEPAPGANSNSSALLPTATHDAQTGDLVFVFRRNVDSVYLDSHVEYSTTLSGTWQDGPDGTVIGTETGFEIIEVRLPSSLAPDGRIFARLSVPE